MWCEPGHMKAQTTASGKKNPFASPALIAASLPFGATPTTPMPLRAAAIVPAVCVPCPLSSFHADGSLLGLPPMHETLFSKSRFGLRSGWLKSAPVSMSPTVTERLPLVIDCASNAWIWRMSHCSPERLSGDPGSDDDVDPEPLASGWVSLSLVTPLLVLATASTRVSAFTFEVKSVWFDLTTATPICA